MRPSYFKNSQKFFLLKSNVIFAATLFILSTLVFNGCKKQEKVEEKKIVHPVETARIVSHVTSGIISSSEGIFIRFVHPVIKADLVESVLKKQVFYFKPEIEGIARWKDRHTLIFKPNTKLPFRQQYTGEIRTGELLPQYKDLKPVLLNFTVAGREIVAFQGDFDLQTPNDPNLLLYRGTIEFTESVEMDVVKKSVSLTSTEGTLPLKWTVKEKNKKFELLATPIKRTLKTKYFYLKINKKPLELSDPFQKRIVLKPLKDLVVTEIRIFDQGKKPGLEIEFSDKLDPNQDLTGLIRVEWDKAVAESARVVTVNFKPVGKRIYLEGNFSYGESFTVKLSGIRSKWGTRIKKEIEKKIDIEDKKPQISFISNGVFLPSVNQQKIGFKTINVKQVHLEVKKVFESNLGQFLQTEKIGSKKQRNQRFNYNYVNRVGIPVASKKLEIGKTKNRWLTHELDLKQLIKPGEKGLYLIRLSFVRKDMLYKGLSKQGRYYRGSQYYSNPNSYGYLYRHGQIFKAIVLSDIGITYKRGGGNHFVFTSNIVDSTPMDSTKVTLRTYQNQIIATKYTDGKGRVTFSNIKDKVFFIEAEKNGERSLIKPREMAWNLSSFDTGGAEIFPDGTRTFIYTERGVYRPGDKINLSLVARNDNNTFPDNHPVTLKILNPKNQLVFTTINKSGTDGFYSFSFNTKPDDLTGNWRAEFTVGSQKFYHTLKIETVVPYRLKVHIKPEKSRLSVDDKKIGFDLNSTYLFGNPASFLKAEVSVTLKHQLKTFPKYSGFIFNNESIKFRPIKTDVFDGKLDKNGSAKIERSLPPLDKAPAAIVAQIIAKVFEKGGRATRNDHMVPIDPYKNYIGLEKPKFKYGYCRVGSPVNINSILADNNGQVISGRSLKYRIYKNSRYWWWEYNTRNDFRVRYKKDVYTKLVKEGSIRSKNVPVSITFKPEETGEYLIEVEEGVKKGHTAGFFFSSYYWGASPLDTDNIGALIVKTDKPVYNPGDTAIVSFPKPEKGTIVVTVEKANGILKNWVYKTEKEKFEAKFQIPVTEEMLPNAYVSVSIIQPHSQTLNDRPIRMYGVVPLFVVDPNTRQEIRITMPDELKSNQVFKINLQTTDKKPTQYTIAVVDEGLLDLTRFRTPDPWKNFFKKQRLMIQTCDLFSLVIGANKGDIFRLFSIGGGLESEESYRRSQLEPGKAKRFKPVSMFKGPLKTDEIGHSSITFKMPNYIGSVRVMVVAASGNCYAKSEKTVPVKTDLMILPTLPRVLGPGDKIIVPVTVFVLKDHVKDVDVSIMADGPVNITGNNRHSIFFEKPGEKDVTFFLSAKHAVGTAVLTINAKSANFKTEKRTEISIRSYSPRIYSSETKECLPGKFIELTIPNRGISGTNRAEISVMRKPKLNLNHRLNWLIHYPYGCIEQTVSTIFPQLYLKAFIKKSAADEEAIDANINAGIERLRRFQLPSGSFTYWPGAKSTSIWGTNFAHHFLIEAKKRGYNVPSDMLSRVIRFQKSRTLLTRDNVLERIYRLYVLALSGESQIGPMNLLKENNLKKMTNTEKWLLAGAYFIAGKKDSATKILSEAKTTVKDYNEFGGTYGSGLRDRAIILEITTLMEDWNKADLLYDDITDELSSRSWYSTQTLGYSLLALGKYINVNEDDFREEKPEMSGSIKLPGKKKISFKTGELKYSEKITEGFGKNVKIHINEETNLKRAFIVLEWNGIPLKPDIKDISKNLRLAVEWLNEDGMSIEPASLKQGTTFWGHFRVGVSPPFRRKIEELALVQLLPSGWEIENIRLLKEDLPTWMKKWNLNREEYLDIRDDRIMWFFDMIGYNRTYDFVVKLNAVTVGEFVLPPTLFEAMYNNRYQAVKKGKNVKVINRKKK